MRDVPVWAKALPIRRAVSDSPNKIVLIVFIKISKADYSPTNVSEIRSKVKTAAFTLPALTKGCFRSGSAMPTTLHTALQKPR
jgi:hypothetical protein